MKNSAEYKYLARLSAPIVVGQLGVTIQGVVDTIMLGQYSTTALAAAGFVNSIFTLASVIVLGFSYGIIPLSGAAYGRGDTKECGNVLKTGVGTTATFSIIAIAILCGLFIRPQIFGQPEELLPQIHNYFWWVIPSLLFVGLGGAFKSFFDSITHTKVAMWAILISNVWNIIWNVFLIYGTCGFPEMGVTGAAIATSTSRLILVLIYIIGMAYFKAFKPYWHAFLKSRMTLKTIEMQCRMGIPTAVQSGLEISAFSLCAVMAGWLGTEAQATHQIMINLATTIWMVYFGIGSAVAIRVSNFVGQGNLASIRNSALCGIKMIMFAAVILNALFLIFHDALFAMFTPDKHLIMGLHALILPLVLYQFGDALQTNYLSALRGLGRVKFLIIDAFIAYFIVSLPLSYIFGFTLSFGLPGIWMGFPFALTTAAALYIWRFLRYTRFKKK